MIVGDPSVSTIPYVIFCQQVLNIDLPFGPICRSSFGAAPPPGQLEACIRIGQTRNRSFQILLRDVALMNPGNLPSVSIWERAGRFRRTQLGSIGKDRDQIAFDRIFQFRFQSRNGSEILAPIQPELRIGEDIQQAERLQSFRKDGFEFFESWRRALFLGFVNNRLSFFNRHLRIEEVRIDLTRNRVQPGAHVIHKSRSIDRNPQHHTIVVD